jgi:hypothetical protein
MPKKKTRVIQFSAPAVETVVPLEAEIEPSVGDEPIVRLTYAFPTKSRCPGREIAPGVRAKCGSLSTRATSTQGQIQHRRCLRPSCRATYKEVGTTL